MQRSSSVVPSILAASAVFGLALLGAGCDAPDCSSTCQRLFVDGAVDGTTGCGITHPGQSSEDLIEACNYDCQAALDNPGEMGDYNPDERITGSTSVELVTDVQAAAWMDCVWATDCEFLNDGYCAPTSFSQ